MSDNTPLKIVKFILSLASIVLSILCIVWLAKVYKNAKNEPTDRLNYYLDENNVQIINSYNPGKFCHEHYDPFLEKGAFEDLDVRMKKIRKFSLASVILIGISFGLTIINILIIIIGLLCQCNEDFFKIMLPIILILSLFCSIIAFIFFIILSVHYFKSNFDDFDKFSECDYINPMFDKDYDFVHTVKDNYLKYFIVHLVLFVLNIIDYLIGRIMKKNE